MKAKIGYPTVQEDVAVIRAIRKAVGDGVAIMVDYNQCLTPAEAVERLRVLDDEGLTWVEEPTLAHDYAGHARDRPRGADPDPVRRELVGRARPAARARRPGVGLRHARRDEDRRRDRLAPRRGAGPGAGHPRVEPPLARDQRQLLCVTPTAHWLEYADWWNPITGEPLAVKDGMADVSGATGSGVSWDEGAIEGYGTVADVSRKTQREEWRVASGEWESAEAGGGSPAPDGNRPRRPQSVPLATATRHSSHLATRHFALGRCRV